MSRIFVSIISCREKFLEQTVLSAINNSYDPERIVFGIFNTVIDEDFFSLNKNNIIVKNYSSDKLLGIGMSRKKSIEMCPENIDYILQIDSHMVFEKNWDKTLIEKINEIELNHNKIIISSFLNSWYIGEDGEVILPELGKTDPNNVPSKLSNYAVHIGYADQEQESYPKTWGHTKEWEGKTYLEVSSVSGNFVFSRAQTFKEIPHDERCSWGADEGVFAMRAWTRGYKIFTINNKIAYHLDKNKDTLSKIKKDWRHYYEKRNQNVAGHNIKNANLGYDNDLDRSYELIKKIFLGEEIGEFGAPSADMLEKYEKFCSFSFKEFYKKR